MVKLHASFLSCGTFLAFAMARCGGKVCDLNYGTLVFVPGRNCKKGLLEGVSY